MAKASTPASESGAKKPRAPRKAAVTASVALDKKETGADAPVSSSVEKAATGDTSTTTNPPAAPAAGTPPVDGAGQADQAAAQLVIRERVFFPGMGRFPEGWKPKQPPESDDVDDAEGAQTTDEEGAAEAVQSSVWRLPDIAKFPAELTLVNNTRNILVVRPLNTRLLQFGEAIVQCPTAKHYDAINREFAGRALRERWDSDKGLQVKHGED